MTRIKRLIGMVAALASLSLSACIGGSSSMAGMAGQTLASPPAGGVFKPEIAAEYHIAPLDKVSINVYPDKSLSRDTKVNNDGTILVPPVGLIRAAGRTSVELTRDIQDRLKACCLQDPQVAVEVTEAFSQQITVMGAVKTPNTYNLRGRTTLAQAVAMAGGTDDALADTGRVGVIRYQNGQRSGQVFNLKSILAGRANDPEIYGGDQIIVDTSTAKSTWKTLLQAIPLAGVFAMF